jgi:hypothetical protein
VDDEQQTLEVARELGFPVAYGMTREDADRIGAWWESRRDHIQPAEFLLTGSGRVLSSCYSSSPIGRTDPGEALALLGILSARKRQGG